MTANPNKQTFTTFNDKLANFFSEKGAKVIPLYAADGVTCHQVTLRGKAQTRLVKSTEYADIAAAGLMDMFRVLAARLQLPFYSVKKNGVWASVADDNGIIAVPISRDREFLAKIITPPDGDAPTGDLVLVATLEELQDLLQTAKRDNIPAVRFFLGYGYNGHLPYQETHPLTNCLYVLP